MFFRHVKSLKVIDSYWVSQDGTYKYYEVIMVDQTDDNVMRDYNVRDILARRRRERTEIAGRMISNNLSPPRNRPGSGPAYGFHQTSKGYRGGYVGSSGRYGSPSRPGDERAMSTYSHRSASRW